MGSLGTGGNTIEMTMSRRSETDSPVGFPSFARDAEEYRPALLPTEPEGVCEDLRTHDQWLSWEPLWVEEIGYPPGGHWSLNPVDSDSGETTAPGRRDAWRSYAEAAAAWGRRGVGGVGFVLTCQDPFLVVE